MRRDLLKLGRNPLTIFTSVLLPIIYLVIFGNSFQGVLKHLPVVIVSQDNGPYAIRVMEQMQALAAGPKTIAITYKQRRGRRDPGRARRRLQGRADHSARLQPRDRRGPHRRTGIVHRQRRHHQRGDARQACSSQATAVIRVGYVTAREPKLNQIVLRPSNLFTTVDYDRSLIPGVIVMALFMGSLTSGVFNWVMDRFMGDHRSATW